MVTRVIWSQTSISIWISFTLTSFFLFHSIAEFAKEVPLSQKAIDALFCQLDTDHDGRISYSEFSNAISHPRSDVSLPTNRGSPRRQLESSRHSISMEKSGELKKSYDSPIKSVLKNSEYREHPSEDKKSYESPIKAVLKNSGYKEYPFERKNSYESPVKSVLKNGEYREYLTESRKRSSSPKRDQPEEKEIFKTPVRSTLRLDESMRSSTKKSPERDPEEEEFAQVLKQLISSIRSLENAKNDLAVRSDFNLFDAFRYFDVKGSGAHINSKQFEKGLADLKFFPTKDQVSLLFKKYGRDYNGYFR